MCDLLYFFLLFTGVSTRHSCSGFCMLYLGRGVSFSQHCICNYSIFGLLLPFCLCFWTLEDGISNLWIVEGCIINVVIQYLPDFRVALPRVQGKVMECNVPYKSKKLSRSIKSFPGWPRAELLSVDGPLALPGLLCSLTALTCSGLQVAEEEYLIQELRKIETRKKEREKRTQDLQKLITAADTTTEQRRAERKAPKKKLPQKKETEKPVNISLSFKFYFSLSSVYALAG